MPDQNKPTVEELQGQLAAANKTIAALKAEKTQRDADEKIIVEKMSRGLSREQAISVIKRQREHDAAKAATAKTTTKK